MNKNVFGRKLGRDREERKALFKSLMSSLILKEGIQTSEAKAKAIKPEIEKLITKAKSMEKGARLVLEKSLSKDAYDKIIKEIGPRFAKRQGGYTRIVKLGERFGDNSPLVLIELVERAEIMIPTKQEKSAKKSSLAKSSKEQEKLSDVKTKDDKKKNKDSKTKSKTKAAK
jgi:large subunit ribosomal protein L17